MKDVTNEDLSFRLLVAYLIIVASVSGFFLCTMSKLGEIERKLDLIPVCVQQAK